MLISLPFLGGCLVYPFGICICYQLNDFAVIFHLRLLPRPLLFPSLRHLPRPFHRRSTGAFHSNFVPILGALGDIPDAFYGNLTSKIPRGSSQRRAQKRLLVRLRRAQYGFAVLWHQQRHGLRKDQRRMEGQQTSGNRLRIFASAYLL